MVLCGVVWCVVACFVTWCGTVCDGMACCEVIWHDVVCVDFAKRL